MISYGEAKMNRIRERLEKERCTKMIIAYRDDVGDRKSLIFEDSHFFLCDGKEKTMDRPYTETLWVLFERLRNGCYPVLHKAVIRQDEAFDSIKKRHQNRRLKKVYLNVLYRIRMGGVEHHGCRH